MAAGAKPSRSGEHIPTGEHRPPMTILTDYLPTIDLDAVQAAIYAWPYSPLRDCLDAAGIPILPVLKLIEIDPSIETMVTYWLMDRAELEGYDD